MTKHQGFKGHTLQGVNLLTFGEGMDAQPDRGEVALPDLPSQLIEANPPTEHQLVDDLLVVGHVVDDPLEWRLPESLHLGQLR